MMNGLITQLTRIKPGHNIQEAHMRNRSLIAHWTYENYPDIVTLEKTDGKTFLRIADYTRLRGAFACLLAEIQRIKSEGDYEAARNLVEKYGVNVDRQLHSEVLQRYAHLGIAPYKGFLNPQMRVERDADGNITDVTLHYDETFAQQMLRYSSEYGFL